MIFLLQTYYFMNLRFVMNSNSFRYKICKKTGQTLRPIFFFITQ